MKKHLYKTMLGRRSTRARFWDYKRSAAYFITICTKERIRWFGDSVEVDQGNAEGFKTRLTSIGHIVEAEWLKTFTMRPDMNLRMGEYVIMPDHFHGIVIIGKNEFNTCRDGMHPVPTGVHPITTMGVFGPQSKNLASVVRGFKIGVTRRARLINPEFAWQGRYYDHIIRNENSFRRISKYIQKNPVKWVEKEQKSNGGGGR